MRARVGRQCYRSWGKMLLLPSGVIDAMTLRKEEAFDVRKRVSVDGEMRERELSSSVRARVTLHARNIGMCVCGRGRVVSETGEVKRKLNDA